MESPFVFRPLFIALKALDGRRGGCGEDIFSDLGYVVLAEHFGKLVEYEIDISTNNAGNS